MDWLSIQVGARANSARVGQNGTGRLALSPTVGSSSSSFKTDPLQAAVPFRSLSPRLRQVSKQNQVLGLRTPSLYTVMDNQIKRRRGQDDAVTGETLCPPPKDRTILYQYVLVIGGDYNVLKISDLFRTEAEMKEDFVKWFSEENIMHEFDYTKLRVADDVQGAFYEQANMYCVPTLEFISHE